MGIGLGRRTGFFLVAHFIYYRPRLFSPLSFFYFFLFFSSFFFRLLSDLLMLSLHRYCFFFSPLFFYLER